MIKPNELEIALAAKGYVRTALGWVRPVGVAAAKNTGATEPGKTPEMSGGNSEGELPHSELQEQQALDHEAAERSAAQASVPDYSPEFQEWKEKAVQSLESQLLFLCQTEGDATQPVRSKLFAMLSRLPEDDSVNDLPEGSWKVVRVQPGEEGCEIRIERL